MYWINASYVQIMENQLTYSVQRVITVVHMQRITERKCKRTERGQHFENSFMRAMVGCLVRCVEKILTFPGVTF